MSPTKGEIRKARKEARARGESWQGPIRTEKEERARERSFDKWARRYDELNGAPEGWWDR